MRRRRHLRNDADLRADEEYPAGAAQDRTLSRDAEHSAYAAATPEVTLPPLGPAAEQTLEAPILPAPGVLTSLTPASIGAGPQAVQVVVAGSGFTTDAKIWADEEQQATAYVSPGELRYFAQADQAGTQTITVRDVGGTSNAIELTVA